MAVPSITLTSPAKLNLFLHINGRRAPDQPFAGYHELQTIFQILDYGDSLTFTANSQNAISISPDIPEIPLEQNLIHKAAILLKKHGIENHKLDNSAGVNIQLEKRLPMGGGLGGGSSNAATTLLALNHLWSTQLSTQELMQLGAELGADVPIFIYGKTAEAEGIGEQLKHISLPENWFVVLMPDCHISTAEIFSHERLTRDTPKTRIAPALEGQAQKQLFQQFLSTDYRNDFESLVCELYPAVKDAIAWLSQYGSARMTGSGACCFCPVDNKETAEKVLNEARSKFKGFIAKGVQLSPALQRLNEA